MDRGAWWAPVHVVTEESDTTYRLNHNNSHEAADLLEVDADILSTLLFCHGRCCSVIAVDLL